MKHSQQPGKRIVSKGAYAKAQTHRAFMGIMSIGLGFAVVFMGLLAAACVVMMGVCLVKKDSGGATGSLLSVLVLGSLSLECGDRGRAWLERAKRVKVGTPFTRANTADLPANDSLVRASQEPVQAQEDILLRAITHAQAGQQKAEGQLLRASVGGE